MLDKDDVAIGQKNEIPVECVIHKHENHKWHDEITSVLLNKWIPKRLSEVTNESAFEFFENMNHVLFILGFKSFIDLDCQIPNNLKCSRA